MLPRRQLAACSLQLALVGTCRLVGCGEARWLARSQLARSQLARSQLARSLLLQLKATTGLDGASLRWRWAVGDG